MVISLLQMITRPMFGTFEREEYKKFLRMGLIFTTLIGSYWTMRPLKDGIFDNLVDAAHIPWAKTLSLFILIPTVMLYTQLLEKNSREKMFHMLCAFYGITLLLFSLVFISPIGLASDAEVAARTGLFWWLSKGLGYIWYVYVESFGSLIIALFWAIASDTTMPESAKKGFPFVVCLGQIGGIVGPKYLSRVPDLFSLQTSALTVAVIGVFVLLASAFFTYFMKATPAHLLTSFHGKNEAKEEAEQEPGFTEGLKLVLQHKYLISMFAVYFFYEFIVTIFDLHFKFAAAQMYTGKELNQYLSDYGSWVNTVALICLLLGVSNITRYLGVTVALIILPLIIGGALVGFNTVSHLEFLFWLMVGSKAINYALNGPTMKQLYIPTTHDVRFKSSAWIETFGSRASKEGGSIFNMLLAPLTAKYGVAAGRAMHAMWASYLGYAMVVVWVFIAAFLGKTYTSAIDEKRVVC